MTLNQDLLDEINMLNQFDLSSMRGGIKVHSDAPRTVIKAARRLYDKGLIDQADGGYLTHRGIEAAQHVQALVGVLQLSES